MLIYEKGNHSLWQWEVSTTDKISDTKLIYIYEAIPLTQTVQK